MEIEDRIRDMVRAIDALPMDRPRLETCVPLFQEATTLKRRLMHLLDLVYYRTPIDAVLPDVAQSLSYTITKVRICQRLPLGLPLSLPCSCERARARLLRERNTVEWVISVLVTGQKEHGKLPVGKLPKLEPIPEGISVKRGEAWFFISLLYGGCQMYVSANLFSLVGSKKRIVDEGGADALINMMRLRNAPKCRMAGAHALIALCGESERAQKVFESGCVAVIIDILKMSVRRSEKIAATELVQIIAEFYPASKRWFGESGVTHILIKLVSDLSPSKNSNVKKSGSSCSLLDCSYDMDKERIRMRITAAGCLAVLTKYSSVNCQAISGTVGLLKLAEFAKEGILELQVNCLEALRNTSELVAASVEFRNQVFAPHNPAAMNVLQEIRDLIKPTRAVKLSASGEIRLLTICIETLGFFSQLFSKKNNHDVVENLLTHVENADLNIKEESLKALERFTSSANQLRNTYAKRLFEAGAVDIIFESFAGNMCKMAVLVLCNLCMSDVDPTFKNQHKKLILDTIEEVDPGNDVDFEMRINQAWLSLHRLG